jgi:hypothetical protein
VSAYARRADGSLPEVHGGTVGGPTYAELEAEVARLKRLLGDHSIDTAKKPASNSRPFRGWR